MTGFHEHFNMNILNWGNINKLDLSFNNLYFSDSNVSFMNLEDIKLRLQVENEQINIKSYFIAKICCRKTICIAFNKKIQF